MFIACFVMLYLVVSSSLFCYAVRSVLSICAIILMRRRELVTLCLVTVSESCLFLVMPWGGLQCVIVVFPGHTHLVFWHKRLVGDTRPRLF